MSTKEDRDYCRSIGICIRCMKNVKLGSHVLCEDCIEHQNLYNAHRYEVLRSDILEKNRDFGKKLYTSRKEQGLCTRCGRKAAAGKTKCGLCLEKDRRIHLERRYA